MAKTTKVSKETESTVNDDEALTPEEIAAMQERDAEEVSIPQLPFLGINKSPVDKDGNDIPVQTLELDGKYSKTATFRPIAFYNRLLDMRQDAKTKKWKLYNETIYFGNREEPIDTAGGVACGRLLGRATAGMNPEQLKANKAKANFYGYAFGIVQLTDAKTGKPLEDSPATLVSWRLPAGKAMQISNVLNEVKALNRKIQTVELDIKVVPNKNDRTNANPDLEITFNPSKELPVSDKAYAKGNLQITEFVKATNSDIRKQHFKALQAKGVSIANNASVAATARKLGVKSVEEVEIDEDLDDQIPF